MDQCASSPVYAVVFTEDFAKSPKDVFHSLKEATKFANSPEGKASGARFRKFETADEARSFLATGDYPLSPLATTSTRSVANEPSIPSPSLKITDYTVLKKTIEKNELLKFCELVESNPRYLINTSGDTASILMEGQRYNALHIAARNGRSLFVNKILGYLNDPTFVMDCYGTTEEDALMRMRNIVTSILNTPEKGFCNTPLHFAAKLGHVDVVRSLVVEPLLDISPRNNQGKTPLDEVCQGYNGEDKATRKKEIELLLRGTYVALYRSVENTAPAKLVAVENIPRKVLSHSFVQLPLKGEYHLAAYAGPFHNSMESEDFYHRWTQSGKDVKRSDIDKGYERVGRELASKRMPWAETWFFLPNAGPLNFANSEHLALVNDYLGSLHSGQTGVDPVKTRLSFGDSDEDESDEDFEDALDTLETPLNDSLGGLTDRIADLTLNSPKTVSVKRESSEDDYVTPPSTPPPVYILGLPTKSDSDLYQALNILDRASLVAFGHIRFFMKKIDEMGQKTREWPSKDSPRVNRSATARRLRPL